jgi:hypothetical protein
MVPQNCHPDRSVAQWRDLRFLPRSAPKVRLATVKPCFLSFGRVRFAKAEMKAETEIVLHHRSGQRASQATMIA